MEDWRTNEEWKKTECILLDTEGKARHYKWKYFGLLAPGLNYNHYCDNPCCINGTHIWIGTQKENMEDKIRKGRGIKGWKHTKESKEAISKALMGKKGSKLSEIHKRALTKGCSKLTEEQARYVKTSNKSEGELAGEFSVSLEVIRRIKTGRTWRWLND